MAIINTAAARKKRMFKPAYTAQQPWKRPDLPPGTYDPSLDTDLRAKQKEYDYLTNEGYGDIPQARSRSIMRKHWSLGDVGQSHTRGLEDLGSQQGQVQLGYDRNLADLLTSRRETGEDYQRNLSGLERQYGMQRSNQEQAAARAGVSQGGALRQAMAKRTANQAWDRQPIDTNYNRFTQRSQLTEGRLGEDLRNSMSEIERQRARLNEEYAQQTDPTGRLGQETGWELGDLDQQGIRAKERLGEFEIATDAAKLAQARTQLTAADWKNYEKPHLMSPGGTAYKVLKGAGGKPRYLLKSGRVVTKRPA